MAEQHLKVFVSHSHEDDDFCRELVEALRQAGTSVWYDEDNLGSGQLIDKIEIELRERPAFVVVLSPAALKSQWVRNETKWAFQQTLRDPSRILLPVLAEKVTEADIWLFLQDFKRIEAPGGEPLLVGESVRRTLHVLSLTPAGEAFAPIEPQPAESAEDLITRAKALVAGVDHSEVFLHPEKHMEAVSLLERATQLAPENFDAWFNLAKTLSALGFYENHEKAVVAYRNAIALEQESAEAWSGLASELGQMGDSPEEAWEAADMARDLYEQENFERNREYYETHLDEMP